MASRDAFGSARHLKIRDVTNGVVQMLFQVHGPQGEVPSLIPSYICNLARAWITALSMGPSLQLPDFFQSYLPILEGEGEC